MGRIHYKIQDDRGKFVLYGFDVPIVVDSSSTAAIGAHMLYSIGRFLRRTIPSPWTHSRRNCLAAPSGLLVHSTVTRSLLVASVDVSMASQEMAMLMLSFGSSTPFGGSMFRRCPLVVLKAKPMRWPPELRIWENG